MPSVVDRLKILPSPERTTSIMEDFSDESTGFRRHFEQIRGTEHAKNNLIEILLDRLDTLRSEYNQEKLDHERESHFNREVQLREKNYREEIRTLKSTMERDAFVLVLIDGDGMIFKNISQGENGGKEAAARLYESVRDYGHKNFGDLTSDYKVVIKIFANLRGLGETAYKAGIISWPSAIEDFARGFTGSKQLFDFINVGSGKDRADDKITENFRLYLNNCHCRHIIFGCPHDNGYARLLEDVGGHDTYSRVTLLEGVPFGRELNDLKSKYPSTKFPGIFMEDKIVVPSPHLSLSNGNSQQVLFPVNSQNQFDQHSQYQTHSLPSSSSPLPAQSTLSSTAPAIQAIAATNANLSKGRLNPQAGSWASAAATPPAPVASPPPQSSSSPPIPVIPRNKHGQRVDPETKWDPTDLQRIKKLKMCNVHYLRKDCPYGNQCDHPHSYKPNKNELATLVHLNRMVPCRYGTSCDDPLCIYGHRCPMSVEGSKDCKYGNLCRFDVSLHGIDTKIVRTIKV